MGCSQIGCEGVDWIEFVHNMIQWPDCVNTVVKCCKSERKLCAPPPEWVDPKYRFLKQDRAPALQ